MIKIIHQLGVNGGLPSHGMPSHGMPNQGVPNQGVPNQGPTSQPIHSSPGHGSQSQGPLGPPPPVLTREQVFRLWRCAIKDDEELVDEIIERVYENIVAFDYKRAECVIELIVRRSITARWAFRCLLKDMRAFGAPPAIIGPQPAPGGPASVELAKA